MGLAGYYQKFIQHFGVLANPLNRLLSKEEFQWSDAVEAAFQNLKITLTSPSVLRLPNWSHPFVIECDACGCGIEAVLTQNNQPIAYFSKALKETSLALSTYVKEMLATVKSIRKWRPYLLGKSFIVRTDQRSLKYLMEE